MLLSTFSVALAVFTSSVNAAPTWPHWGWGHSGHGSTDLSKLQDMMPMATLPPPDGLQLKYVVLGVGTQNYTCLESEDDEPGTTGALAKLYDIGTPLSKDPLAQWKISTISGLALSLQTNRITHTQFDGYLKSQGYDNQLGMHFFDGSTPTFSLYNIEQDPFPYTQVGKLADVDAPKSACPGTHNEGAVKWLKLADDKGLSKGGINTVYRIETAGGSKPTTCKDMEESFEVQYAAQYWVFGPPA